MEQEKQELFTRFSWVAFSVLCGIGFWRQNQAPEDDVLELAAVGRSGTPKNGALFDAKIFQTIWVTKLITKVNKYWTTILTSSV